jgi:hypothetical protein
MSSATGNLADSTLADADWLAHRYDPGQDAVHFIAAARALRQDVPFLTDEYLPGHSDPRIIGRGELGLAPRPVNYIFHSAYCCSTLLAACFDLPGRSLSLKEPQLLNDMVGWRHRGAPQQALAGVLDHSLALLARPYEPDEVAVIKPSNIVNGLAHAMLSLRPDSRAILLHAPLRVFLTSIARKGLWGRLWVRELFVAQRADGLVSGLGFEDHEWIRQSDLQIAAIGWLAQQRLFHQLLARWPDRLRSLNSEDLIAQSERALRVAAELFGLHLDGAALAGTIERNFGRDSKTGESFTAGRREADRKAGEAVHADEVDKVCVWIEAVAEAVGIDLELPHSLI